MKESGFTFSESTRLLKKNGNLPLPHLPHSRCLVETVCVLSVLPRSDQCKAYLEGNIKM